MLSHAHAIFLFFLISLQGTHKVVWTDYEEALIYICLSEKDDGTCRQDTEFVSVLSRSRRVAPDKLAAVHQVVRENLCIDISDFVTPHSDYGTCAKLQVQAGRTVRCVRRLSIAMQCPQRASHQLRPQHTGTAQISSGQHMGTALFLTKQRRREKNNNPLNYRWREKTEQT